MDKVTVDLSVDLPIRGPLKGETETTPESDEGAFRLDDALHSTPFPGPLAEIPVAEVALSMADDGGQCLGNACEMGGGTCRKW